MIMRITRAAAVAERTALKNVLALTVNTVAAVVFIATTSVDWKVVGPALEKSLGRQRLAELEVDPEPIAAASLGQAHRAPMHQHLHRMGGQAPGHIPGRGQRTRDIEEVDDLGAGVEHHADEGDFLQGRAQLPDALAEFAPGHPWVRRVPPGVTRCFHLQARGGRKGLASLCIGGGEATALALEML